MSKKFIDLDKLNRLSKSLDDRSKAAVKAEEQRALAAEQALQTAINDKAASGHKHDDRYYTESEINTKVASLQAEIDTDVKAEADRAKAAEASLQAAIDGKSASGHTHDDRYYTETEMNTKLASKSDVGHDHDDNYYTEAEIDSKITTINTAINGKANASHGNHVPAVETANNAKFLRNDNTWATVTPDNIGAAEASHGTHVTYAANAPLANGTAAVGSSSKVAREDHVHPLQTAVSGNAGSASKWQNPITLTIGNKGYSVDGSENINWTLAQIGAAPSGHTHDDKYYTETEIDGIIEEVNDTITDNVNTLTASINGKAPSSHTHDDRYYTETEMNTKLAGKSDTGHTHDDRYYTSGQIDTKVSTLNSAIATAKSDAQKYADNKITALVDSAPDAMNTLNELAKAINDHQDEYEAYVQTVSSNITTAKSEAIASAESKDAALKTTLQAEIDADVKVEADRAKAAENTLQANIDKKADASHGNHVPATQTANNAKFLRNDNTWQTVTPANIGAYTKTEIDSKVTTINNAISGKADSSHGNHVPATQTANNAVFLRNDNTWQTITPDNIGAAKSSHGTHVDYATAAPKAPGTAAIGSVNRVAREDHVHPLQTSVSGNAGTATKLATARTINGTSFDGSGNITTANWGSSRNISISDSDGTNTGTVVSVNGSANATLKLPATIKASLSGNASTASSAAKLTTARNITIGNKSNSFNGTANIDFTLDDIGAAPTVHNHAFVESVDTRNTNPNPDTYTERGITPEFKLASGIGLPTVGTNFAGVLTYQQWSDVSDWTGGKTTQFATIDDGRMYYRKGDGSGWGSWYQFYTTQNKPTPDDIGAAASSHGTHVTYATAIPKANDTAAIGSVNRVAREDHVHPLQTSVSGNAGTATKLATARTITIGNKGKSFDGSAGISFTLAEIGAEPLAKTVVSKSKSGTTLTLSTDRYQKAFLASGDTIALPSATTYTEIELFVKDCSLTNINLPDNCKWRVDHNLSAGTSFIIRFVYTTQEWLGEIKIFS